LDTPCELCSWVCSIFLHIVVAYHIDNLIASEQLTKVWLPRLHSWYSYRWYTYDPASKTVVYCPRGMGVRDGMTMMLGPDPAKDETVRLWYAATLAFLLQTGNYANARPQLEHARLLLSQRRLAALSVAEVGRRCGYTDASHFSRDFQRDAGVAPLRWRQQS
jgi:hypothetical protein